MRPVRTLAAAVLLMLFLAVTVSPAGATFPGENGRIVFMSTRVDGLPDVFAMQPDGTGVRNLTSSTHAIDIVPTWAPDGQTITWIRVAEPDRRSVDRDVWLMSADGSSKRKFTRTPWKELAPSFHPNGKEILFAANGQDPDPAGCFIYLCDYELYVKPIGGGPARQLTDSPRFDGWARYSPDGSKIAFTSLRSGQVAVWVMNADGTGARQMTNNHLAAATPDWSPDGTKLVFVDNYCLSCHESHIWMINADRTGLHQVVSFGNINDPHFSPDGTKLLFTSGEPHPYGLYTSDTDGSNIEKLGVTPEGTDDEMADWAPRPAG